MSGVKNLGRACRDVQHVGGSTDSDLTPSPVRGRQRDRTSTSNLPRQRYVRPPHRNVGAQIPTSSIGNSRDSDGNESSSDHRRTPTDQYAATPTAVPSVAPASGKTDDPIVNRRRTPSNTAVPTGSNSADVFANRASREYNGHAIGGFGHDGIRAGVTHDDEFFAIVECGVGVRGSVCPRPSGKDHARRTVSPRE